ncbi:MAG: hypothetical protein ABFD82_15495 [Syntrophaceae bacterium]
MTSFSGKFQYLEQAGTAIQSGSCRLTIEDANLRLIPEKGQPLVLDLGDIDFFSPGDYQLSLKLYTGKTIVLNQFGKTFQNLCHDLLEAFRDRLVQCLLLEDLEEIERFEGFVQLDSTDYTFSSPAQFRLYKSNLAILPETATGLHWRLSDFDTIDFNEATYTLELHSGTERLILTKLAKRTREFIDRLRSAIDDLSDNSARILQTLFPFLSPDQFQLIAGLMREGHATAVSKLAAVHPKVVPVLMEKTVDSNFKPYFDNLQKRISIESDFFAGFKIIRPEGENGVVGDGSGGSPDSKPDGSAMGEPEAAPIAKSESDTGEKEAEQEQVLHWFFFPLAKKPGEKMSANVVAWESTSHSGRATYFFRIFPEDAAGKLMDPAKAAGVIESTVQRLNRALVMLNFKREPIYLPDDSLDTQLRYRRYAIACRRIAVLRELRASYIGRAVHTSPEGWQKQVDAILAQA